MWNRFLGTRESECFFYINGYRFLLWWDVLNKKACFSLPTEETWAQMRWCVWLTRASAKGRGPSISKPGPFYAACATCQVMKLFMLMSAKTRLWHKVPVWKCLVLSQPLLTPHFSDTFYVSEKCLKTYLEQNVLLKRTPTIKSQQCPWGNSWSGNNCGTWNFLQNK